MDRWFPPQVHTKDIGIIYLHHITNNEIIRTTNNNSLPLSEREEDNDVRPHTVYGDSPSCKTCYTVGSKKWKMMAMII